MIFTQVVERILLCGDFRPEPHIRPLQDRAQFLPQGCSIHSGALQCHHAGLFLVQYRKLLHLLRESVELPWHA